MPKQLKYDKILDALQKLLETKELSNISVSEIAQTAEIGKGSIYYYFSSKDAILEALAKEYEFSLDVPFEELSEKAQDVIINGTHGYEVKVYYKGQRGEGRVVADFTGLLFVGLRVHAGNGFLVQR
mgnify:CR=1 FL=1